MRITHCVKKQKDTFCCNPDVTVTQLCEPPLVLVIQDFRATAALGYEKRWRSEKALSSFSSSQQLLVVHWAAVDLHSVPFHVVVAGFLVQEPPAASSVRPGRGVHPALFPRWLPGHVASI